MQSANNLAYKLPRLNHMLTFTKHTLPFSPRNQNCLQKSTEAYCEMCTILLALSSGFNTYLLPEKFLKYLLQIKWFFYITFKERHNIQHLHKYSKEAENKFTKENNFLKVYMNKKGVHESLVCEMVCLKLMIVV